MSTEKSPDEGPAPDLQQEVRTLKEQVEVLKASLAEKKKVIDSTGLRRYLASEADRLGFDREIDRNALRAEGARARRLVRRYPASTVSFAAALGFCAGLLAARR